MSTGSHTWYRIPDAGIGLVLNTNICVCLVINLIKTPCIYFLLQNRMLAEQKNKTKQKNTALDLAIIDSIISARVPSTLCQLLNCTMNCKYINIHILNAGTQKGSKRYVCLWAII